MRERFLLITLDKYLALPNPTFPVKVRGAGLGLTNVPKDATATVTGIENSTYVISWDGFDVTEKLVIFGSVSMDLEVIEQ